MIAMMFVGMPAAVIGGIAWECRKRTRLAEADDLLAAGGMEPLDDATVEITKPR